MSRGAEEFSNPMFSATGHGGRAQGKESPKTEPAPATGFWTTSKVLVVVALVAVAGLGIGLGLGLGASSGDDDGADPPLASNEEQVVRVSATAELTGLSVADFEDAAVADGFKAAVAATSDTSPDDVVINSVTAVAAGRRLGPNDRVRVLFTILVRNLAAAAPEQTQSGNTTLAARVEELRTTITEIVSGNEFAGALLTEFKTVLEERNVESLDLNALVIAITEVQTQLDVVALPSASPSASPSAAAPSASSSTRPSSSPSAVASASSSPSSVPSASSSASSSASAAASSSASAAASVAASASSTPAPSSSSSPSLSASPSAMPTPSPSMSGTPSPSPSMPAAPISIPLYVTNAAFKGAMLYTDDRFERTVHEFDTWSWTEGKPYRFFAYAGDDDYNANDRMPEEDRFLLPHPTEPWLLVQSGQTLVMYDTNTGRILNRWTGQPSNSYLREYTSFLPTDDTMLVVVGYRWMQIIDLVSGNVTRERFGDWETSGTLFNEDGSFGLAIGGVNVHQLEVLENNTIIVQDTFALEGMTTGAVFDAARDRFLVLHRNDATGVYDLSVFPASGALNRTFVVAGIATAPYAFAMTAAPEQNLLAIANGSQVVLHRLDMLMPTGDVLARHESQVTQIRIHPTRPLIFTIAADGKNRQRDLPGFDDYYYQYFDDQYLDDGRVPVARDDDDWSKYRADDDGASYDRVVMENFLWPAPFTARSHIDGPAPSPAPWLERAVRTILVQERGREEDQRTAAISDMYVVALDQALNFTVFDIMTGQRVGRFRDPMDDDVWGAVDDDGGDDYGPGPRMLRSYSTWLPNLRFLGSQNRVLGVRREMGWVSFRVFAPMGGMWMLDEGASFNVSDALFGGSNTWFEVNPMGTRAIVLSMDAYMFVDLVNQAVVWNDTFREEHIPTVGFTNTMAMLPTSGGLMVWDFGSEDPSAVPTIDFTFPLEAMPLALACHPTQPYCALASQISRSDTMIKVFRTDDVNMTTSAEWWTGGRVSDMEFSAQEDVLVLRNGQSHRIAFIDMPAENRTFTPEDDEFGHNRQWTRDWSETLDDFPDWPTLWVCSDDDGNVRSFDLSPAGQFLVVTCREEQLLIQMWLDSVKGMPRALHEARLNRIHSRLAAEFAAHLEEEMDTEQAA